MATRARTRALPARKAKLAPVPSQEYGFRRSPQLPKTRNSWCDNRSASSSAPANCDVCSGMAAQVYPTNPPRPLCDACCEDFAEGGGF